MKTCPNCQRQFNDDYNFCLKDGSALITTANQTAPFTGVTQSLNFCGNCAALMSAEYTFCKNCGTQRSKFEGQKIITGEENLTATSSQWQWFENNKPLVIIGSLVVILPLLIGVIVYSSSSNSNSQTISNANANKAIVINSTRNTNYGYTTNSNYAPSNQTYSSSTTNGKTGRFTTDLNIRDAPNKDSYTLGIHFKDAKVEILETTSYELNGAVSTWHKIRVTEYGCSKDASLGCGKNSPSDADEGWVNAKYILLD